jgi:hypothetical protein
MNALGKYRAQSLHPKRLGDSSAAIAGLAGGLSVLIGLGAAHFAPRGLARVSLALHITRMPLLLRLEPLIAAVAVAVAAASGIIRFHTGWQQQDQTDDREGTQ